MRITNSKISILLANAILATACSTNSTTDPTVNDTYVWRVADRPSRTPGLVTQDYDPTRLGSPVTNDPKDILNFAMHAGFAICHAASTVAATPRDGWVTPQLIIWRSNNITIIPFTRGPVWEAREAAHAASKQYRSSAEVIATTELWANGDFADHDFGTLYIRIWTPRFEKSIAVTQEFDLAPELIFSKPLVIHSGLPLTSEDQQTFGDIYDSGALSNPRCNESWKVWNRWD